MGHHGAWGHNAGIPNSDPRLTILYILYDEAGEFLEWGISCNPKKRYSKKMKYIMEKMYEGSRKEMLELERYLITRVTRGPLNKERFK